MANSTLAFCDLMAWFDPTPGNMKLVRDGDAAGPPVDALMAWYRSIPADDRDERSEAPPLSEMMEWYRSIGPEGRDPAVDIPRSEPAKAGLQRLQRKSGTHLLAGQSEPEDDAAELAGDRRPAVA